jgi:hypothetical protein
VSIFAMLGALACTFALSGQSPASADPGLGSAHGSCTAGYVWSLTATSKPIIAANPGLSPCVADSVDIQVPQINVFTFRICFLGVCVGGIQILEIDTQLVTAQTQAPSTEVLNGNPVDAVEADASIQTVTIKLDGAVILRLNGLQSTAWSVYDPNADGCSVRDPAGFSSTYVGSVSLLGVRLIAGSESEIGIPIPGFPGAHLTTNYISHVNTPTSSSTLAAPAVINIPGQPPLLFGPSYTKIACST